MSDLRDEALVERRVRRGGSRTGSISFYGCAGKFLLADLRCATCGSWRTEAEFDEHPDGDLYANCRCLRCAEEWSIRPHRVPARLHAQVASGEEGEG